MIDDSLNHRLLPEEDSGTQDTPKRAAPDAAPGTSGDGGPHGDEHPHDDHRHNHDHMATPLLGVAHALEEAEVLDGPADLARPWAQWLTAEPVRRAALQGAWLGHKLHPVLSDLPVGFWSSATTLDLLQGEKSAKAADTLVALGIATAVPTALTGWADWGSAPKKTQRVGIVHAAANAAALTLYTASLIQRRRGKRTSGVVLGLVASGALGAGGFLGGHMAAPGS
ncbi:hypothetical protein Sked_02690 [Sanguibacter keddieii DSM 10542]|uniref:DUF2231 domain-containing protein n=1 Tax=Sanguibacter keddieii (strain ATCC 51767 / DSM 10542 / NCFB 3025 / ST-74) TaxID=446469 RepID=D1BJI2_SANKS|nr:DUF2231 domain-containing protein [Sanguibacter keddieii]ACZ20238.1 hypothetical protein Sked_02690 [Sanguibacter keddieii DSM 10542]